MHTAVVAAVIAWVWLLMLPTTSASGCGYTTNNMPNTSSASACDVKYLGPGIGTIGDEDGICHDLVTLDQCIDTGIEYIQVHHATRVDAVRMKCVGGVSLEGEVVGEVNDFYSLPCKDADPPGIANISASLMSYEDDARQYPFDMVVTCVDGSQFGPYGDGDAVNGSKHAASTSWTACEEDHYAAGFSYPRNLTACDPDSEGITSRGCALFYLRLVCLPNDCSVEKEQEPFYEAGWFAATTAVVGVVGGSLVCFVTGIWRLCRSCLQWMRVPGAGDTSVGVAAGNAGSHASGENDNTASTRDDNQPGPSS